MTVSASHVITVPTHVRDALRQLAAAEGRTVDGMLGKLIDEYLWRLEVEKARRAMREAPQGVWDDYMSEVKEWDATLMDGLEDDPWDEGRPKA